MTAGRRLVEAAWSALQRIPEPTSPGWSFRLGIAPFQALARDPGLRDILVAPDQPDQPWRLFDRPVQVVDDPSDAGLTLLPPFQVPASLAPATRSYHRCEDMGHVVTFTDPVCRICGTDTAGSNTLAWPEGVDPDAAYREAMGQPEPTDPVDWLERHLDQQATGQDAASIKARLAAIEATLANAPTGAQPEHNWQDAWPPVPDEVSSHLTFQSADDQDQDQDQDQDHAASPDP